MASAKAGIGIKVILEAVVTRIPAPKNQNTGPLQALIFDSWFDFYLGGVSLVRVVAGTLTKGQKIQMMSCGKVFEVIKLEMVLGSIYVHASK